jgi:hypothetical protein
MIIVIIIGLMIAIIASIFGISVVDANATPQIVTQEQIRQFCDPSSTHMKFVNADESKICNVPESTPTTPNDSTTAISPSAK